MYNCSWKVIDVCALENSEKRWVAGSNGSRNSVGFQAGFGGNFFQPVNEVAGRYCFYSCLIVRRGSLSWRSGASGGLLQRPPPYNYRSERYSYYWNALLFHLILQEHPLLLPPVDPLLTRMFFGYTVFLVP